MRLAKPLERILYHHQIHPVILEYEEGRFQDVSEFVRPYVYNLTDNMPILARPALQRAAEAVYDLSPRFEHIRSFRYLATILPRGVIEDIADGERNIRKVYYNQILRALQTITPYSYTRGRKHITFVTTEQTKKFLGLDKAAQKGFTGRGIKVMVIDTGASRTHPQLVSQSLEVVSEMAQRFDKNGHGTWCVSCILGARQRDDRSSRFVGHDVYVEGMAPDAIGIADKTLGYVIGTGPTSNIAKALERALASNIDVVSMSLGGEVNYTNIEDDPLYKPVHELTARGTIVVAAAGNSGPDENTVNTPGALPDCLTVGAWDEINGKVADFSSRGPTPWGDTKPDVIAPGVNILSATVGLLDEAGDYTKNRYSPLSGTSMATPHVAGMMAIAKQVYRERVGKELTTEEVKSMMATYGTKKDNESGWGLITWKMFEDWLSSEYGVSI